FVDLVFDDAATGMLPDDGPIVAGTYQLSDYLDGPDDFPSGPPGPYGSTLASFNGTDPNGVWGLYIVDDQANNEGSLSDWKLTISTLTHAATVVDTLPAGTTFNSASGSGWSCSAES